MSKLQVHYQGNVWEIYDAPNIDNNPFEKIALIDYEHRRGMKFTHSTKLGDVLMAVRESDKYATDITPTQMWLPMTNLEGNSSD